MSLACNIYKSFKFLNRVGRIQKKQRAFTPTRLYAEKKEVNAAAVETETDLSAELAKYVKNIKPKVGQKRPQFHKNFSFILDQRGPHVLKD